MILIKAGPIELQAELNQARTAAALRAVSPGTKGICLLWQTNPFGRGS